MAPEQQAEEVVLGQKIFGVANDFKGTFDFKLQALVLPGRIDIDEDFRNQVKQVTLAQAKKWVKDGYNLYCEGAFVKGNDDRGEYYGTAVVFFPVRYIQMNSPVATIRYTEITDNVFDNDAAAAPVPGKLACFLV